MQCKQVHHARVCRVWCGHRNSTSTPAEATIRVATAQRANTVTATQRHAHEAPMPRATVLSASSTSPYESISPPPTMDASRAKSPSTTPHHARLARQVPGKGAAGRARTLAGMLLRHHRSQHSKHGRNGRRRGRGGLDGDKMDGLKAAKGGKPHHSSKHGCQDNVAQRAPTSPHGNQGPRATPASTA